ncbi:MAG: lasso peptide biosynthesis B2 protein [Bryobacterales bacterium]|nr:lasso peptide biosynthesis B2 protein [Bryobacterales bacterium]
MNSVERLRVIAVTLWELVRYDLTSAISGFARVHRNLAEFATRNPVAAIAQDDLLDTVALAICFYPWRVRCLQRSVATVRVLRRNGVDARAVIGYRTAPFFSHAWVEVQGRVVGDAAGYQRMMHVLERI